MRILVVCTGNICRSPMAEAMLRQLATERQRADVTVESAGTGAYDGGSASEGAYLIGLEHGLDLSAHQSRPITRQLVEAADLILGMSPHHVERAVALGGDGKAHLLGTYAGRPDHDAEVEDPFGGDLDEYRRTFEQLSLLLPAVLDRALADDD